MISWNQKSIWITRTTATTGQESLLRSWKSRKRIENLDEIDKAIKNYGVQILDNEEEFLSNNIKLIGVDDSSGEILDDYENELDILDDNLNSENFNICLIHKPDYYFKKNLKNSIWWYRGTLTVDNGDFLLYSMELYLRDKVYFRNMQEEYTTTIIHLLCHVDLPRKRPSFQGYLIDQKSI